MMDLVRLFIPFSRENRERLDTLMELGLISAYENTLNRLCVLGEKDEEKRLLAVLDEYLPGVETEIEDVPDQDWNRIWRENFRELPVGKSYWVCPPWQTDGAVPDGRRRLVINPGQAFGTGTHESTQLMMELLEEVPPAGKDVLDLGCGSGILSICASILGARSVQSVDYDKNFCDNMSENLSLNGISNVEYSVANVFKMTDFPGEYCLMNIEKHIIKPALTRMTDMGVRFPELLLSGLLSRDEEEMTEFLLGQGYEVSVKRNKGEWLGLYCTPSI